MLDKYDSFFNKNINKKVMNISKLIMFRFCIKGICDGMYIYNSINEIKNTNEIALFLTNVYRCNIEKDDKNEIIEIISSGYLDAKKTLKGLENYILKCEKEKSTCDEWRKQYLNSCILQAKENIEILNNHIEWFV